ncbi:MAG TPA: low-specificity L-threonine aldolase [Fimbriiglobus sp.]|jgi:threonine aldolase
MIDLRSDTVTKPTKAMLAAMMAAEVGDDVFGEDPTIRKLEERVAHDLGKEAALFVPSGTMSNQIAVRLHCRPGDELICESTSHVYLWEAGGPAALSGVTCRTIDGTFGILNPEQFEGKIRPKDMHAVQTRLVCLENTHNRGGGTIYPLEKTKAISSWAKANGLALHLDGARIWNAAVAAKVPLKTWAEPFDTVSVCFSKGLGAAVGSALAGPKDLIAKGRWIRKLFGGAMRQAGILAAGCLYAMDRHIERLAEDHANAKLLAAAVASVPGLTLTPKVVETNLVWFEVEPTFGTAQDVAGKLKEQGVLVAALGNQVIRACTHLDASKADVETAAAAVRGLAAA